ncbi:MAG: hypothetical protein JWM31_1397 [Solirubrobacterales bacterium]|nr:hypothetical protein [Solirubrobacterales bacterium]
MATEEKIGFCGICEASCGVVITVEDGRMTKIRPDKEHPVSQGFACPKGIALADAANDPERVTEPMQRQADGTFKAVSWDVALEDIGRRLKRVISDHGGHSVGTHLGNPSAFNYGAFFWANGLTAALGSKHAFVGASVDINNYWSTGALLYGHPLINPIPDIDRTDFLLIVGSNMLVSHASMVTAPRIKDRLHAIVGRGGRVVVVDPRRTQTAEAFEWQPIRADEDAWLIVSMLQVIFAEGLHDQAAMDAQARGGDFVKSLVADHPPEATEVLTGVPAEDVRELARAFATAPSASAHGRCGASLGRSSTLVKYLLDALNLVTGNFDRVGGAVIGRPLIDIEDVAWKLGQATYGSWHTRVDGFPEIMGTSPLATMAREITTPGDGQLRALILIASNPGHMGPDSAATSAALAELDLLVSIDFYVNDSGRHADYVLPGTNGQERDQYPWFCSGHSLVPYAQWVPKASDPPGECREEWWILDQIARRIGIVPSPAPAVRALGKLGIRMTPQQSFDLFLRLGPEGDLFGLRRRGYSRKKLWANPRGEKLADHCDTGIARRHIKHKDKLVHLEHHEMTRELEDLAVRPSASAAADLPARVALAQLLDAQRPQAHGRRPRPAPAHPSRRRAASRRRGRRPCAHQLTAGRYRGRGPRQRRDEPRHRRAPAGLGPSPRRFLDDGDRGRRRQLQPARLRSSGGPGPPFRQRPPQRHRGAGHGNGVDARGARVGDRLLVERIGPGGGRCRHGHRWARQPRTSAGSLRRTQRALSRTPHACASAWMSRGPHSGWSASMSAGNDAAAPVLTPATSTHTRGPSNHARRRSEAEPFRMP